MLQGFLFMLSKSNILENKSTGYIWLFRSLKSHWIWSDANKLKWWLDVLLSVNYTDSKVLIKNNLIECKRGQSIKSLETWAKEWRTTKKTVQIFFKLLQSDCMILVENMKVTTRITVCNFDSYNSSVNDNDTAKETQGKRKLPPNKKDNKDNKDNNRVLTPEEILSAKKKSFIDSLSEYKEKYNEDLLNGFFRYWSEATPDKKKLKYEMENTWELKLRLATWARNDLKFNK